MGKEKFKLYLYRILKILVFLAAFPLYAHLVKIKGGSTDGFKLAVLMLLIVAVVQVIMYLIARKKFRARAFVSAFVAFALIFGFVMVYNLKGEAAIDKAKEDYHVGQVEVLAITNDQDKLVDYLKDDLKKSDVTVIGAKGVNFYVQDEKEYEKIKTDVKAKNVTVSNEVLKNVKTTVEEFNILVHSESTASSRLNSFVKTYNIVSKSKVYGTGVNADGSKYKYVEKDDTYVSENGMLADGYVFGYKKAMDILTTYYDTQAYYKAIGEDADEALTAELTRLETTSSAWKSYQNTAEYKAAYGENGSARKYYIDEARLNKILSALGKNLDDAVDGLTTILGLFNLNDYGAYLDMLNDGLNLDQIMTLLEGFGLEVTKDDIMGLLAGYSFYQSPSAKPIYEFIEDDTLKAYGYAKYYGETHGKIVAAVLIGDYIGGVTMDSKGSPAESSAWSLDKIEQLQADLEYEGRLYTYASLRNYGYIFMGIVPLLYLFAYHFADKEKKTFNKMLGKEVA